MCMEERDHIKWMKDESCQHFPGRGVGGGGTEEEEEENEGPIVMTQVKQNRALNQQNRYVSVLFVQRWG